MKRFVNVKVEEEQLRLSTHGQKISKKKSINSFIFRKNKENSYQTEQDECFKNTVPSKSVEKLGNKVKALEGQI